METRICNTCGRELPIEDFAKNGFGVLGICKECMSKKQSAGHKNRNELVRLKDELQRARNTRLSDFTPRELMEELARRGYKGKLQYVKVEEINIEDF